MARNARNINSLVGKKYGRLTILSRDGRLPGNVWCLCDCGNTVSKKLGNVVRGITKSCGCLRKEQMRETAAEANKIDRVFHTNFSLIEKSREDTKSKSGRIGVYQQNNGWVAKICINGDRKYLGYYDDIEKAIEAREIAEKEFFEPLIEAKNEYISTIA